MKKSEVEFVEALRKVGLSRSLCESVNDIRKAVFESEEYDEHSGELEVSDEFQKKVEEYNETHDRSLFDYVSDFDEEGYTEVVLDGKHNFIDKDGDLLWKGDEWFDYVCYFWEGYVRVRLNGKYNFIGKDGDLLWKGETWFDDADDFDEGYADVEFDGKRYEIDTEGNLHED